MVKSSERFEKIAILLPSVLLIGIACTQIAMALFQNLDPWKGGGFGMFSTIDGAPDRVVSCVIRDQDGEKHIVSLWDSWRKPKTKFERTFRKQLRRTRSLPTEQALRELAEVVLNTPVVIKERFDMRDIRWLEEDLGGAELVLPDWIDKSTRIYRLSRTRDWRDERIQKIRPSEVDLKVWRLRFDVKENKFKWALLKEFELKQSDFDKR